MKNVVVAYTLSSANAAELTDEQVAKLQEDLAAVTTVTSEDSFKVENAVIPTGLSSAVATYITTDDKIEAALERIDGLNEDLDTSADEEGEYAYGDIAPLLGDIVNKEYVKIAGKQNLTSSDLNAVIDEFTKTGMVDLYIAFFEILYYRIS